MLMHRRKCDNRIIFSVEIISWSISKACNLRKDVSGLLSNQAELQHHLSLCVTKWVMPRVPAFLVI